MTDNASLADKLEALNARFRNKTPTLKEWVQAVDDLLAFLCVNAPAIITALRADQRCAELEAENARLREVMERCAVIVERNNWRQTEKVDDIPVLLRAALKESRDD